jgi:hypothetical protein
MARRRSLCPSSPPVPSAPPLALPPAEGITQY